MAAGDGAGERNFRGQPIHVTACGIQSSPTGLAMRAFWLRCLVLLFSLALAAGNARAVLPLAQQEHRHSCSGSAVHPPGDKHHRYDDRSHDGCCCDCLGCVSAVNVCCSLGDLGTAFSGETIRYGVASPVLSSRALPPDPGPPRPRTLS
jgi:hypothetical protein